MSAAPQMESAAPVAAPAAAPMPSSSAPAPSPSSSPAEEVATGGVRPPRANPRAERDAQVRRDAAGRFARFKAQADAAAAEEAEETSTFAMKPKAAVVEPDPEESADAPVADDAAVEAEAPAAADAHADPQSWPEPARQALQQAQEAHRVARAEIDEWRGAGQEVHAQNLALLKRVQFWQSMVEQAGINVDPRDLQLLDYEIEKMGRGIGADLTKRQQEAQVKAQSDAMVSQFRSEATNAAKSRNLDADEVLIRWASLIKAHRVMKKAGPEPTIADVADEMAAVAAARQAKANKSVPTLLGKKPTPSGTVVKFTNPYDAMKARGHEID